MALFQLDPASIAERARGQDLPTTGRSVWRGMLGFMALSIAGFTPWPIFDKWFHRMREMDLYIACTLIFVGLSGVFLHRLILGVGSMPRFYAVFTMAFLGYAAAWVGLWMWLRGPLGEFVATAGGAAVMAGIMALAFDAWRSLAVLLVALFACNAAGYYAGREVEGELIIEHRYVAITLWALCYGLGFGAGLGAAFHLCQREARRVIRVE
jgi:hypothetical protein